MDCEDDYVPHFDPGSLLPKTYVFGEQLPPEQRLPKHYGGMLGKGMFDKQEDQPVF